MGFESMLPENATDEEKIRWAKGMGIPLSLVVKPSASAVAGNASAKNPSPTIATAPPPGPSKFSAIPPSGKQAALTQSLGGGIDLMNPTGPAPKQEQLGEYDYSPAGLEAQARRKADEAKKLDAAALASAQFADDPRTATPAPQGSAPTVIPGQRTQAQWQIQEGQPVSKENLVEFNQADEEAKKAAKTGYDAGVEKANEQAGYFNRMQMDQMDREKEMRDRDARNRDAFQIEKHKLNTLVEKSQKGEEDKGAFIVPGALGSFLSGIGVAIGAAAQAWTGSKENPGLAAANHMIEKNMMAQRTAADKAKNAVDQQKTLLGNLRQQFGDEAMAENAAYVTYLERMKTEAQKIDASALPRDAKARYDTFIAGLDGQIAERHLKFDAAAQDKVQRTDIMTQTRVIGGGVPAKQGDVHQYSEDLQKAGIPDSIAQLKLIDEMVNQFDKGDIEGVGPSADARSTLGKIAGYTPVGFGASIISGESPDAMLLSKREQKVRQLRSNIENAALHALSGAAVTESEAGRLMSGLRGANTSEGMRTALDQIRTTVAEKQKNIQAGATPEAVKEYQKRAGTIVDVRRDKSQAPYVKEPK